MSAIELSLTIVDIQKICQSYFKDTQATDDSGHIVVVNYCLKNVSADLSGFFGYHRFLIVNTVIKDSNGRDTERTIRFFTKSAPVEIASRMEYLEQFGVFKKEKSVFADVLPKLEHIYPGLTPKCYYADNNLLVFEDLNLHHFKMAAGRDGLLDYPHLKCTVKTLAAMHAASIVYELQEKKTVLEMHPEACHENAYPLNYPSDHMRYQNFHNGLKVFKEFIKLMPKYRSQMEYILKNLQNKMAIIYPMAQTSRKYRNVFSHGDMWANNVMFQYADDGKTPINCRFVDFQLSRYAPPMLDLITILTIPTSREFRQQYLTVLINDYYRFLREFLKQQQLSVEDFIPQDQFYDSFKEFRLCGLIESCFFSHLTILPPECTQALAGSTDGFTDFFERKRVEICLKAFQTDQIYRERLTDMLEDLVDNYVLVKEVL